MVQPAVRRNFQIIDLTSDDKDDEFRDDGNALLDAHFVGEPTNHYPDEIVHGQYQHFHNGPRDSVDLTAIPDVDVPPSDFSVNEDFAQDEDVNETQLITEAVCLQLVVDVFPDVSINHVLALIREMTTDQMCSKEHSEQIVNKLLESAYPKETEEANKKRKRADSTELSDYEMDGRATEIYIYNTDAYVYFRSCKIPYMHPTA